MSPCPLGHSGSSRCPAETGGIFPSQRRVMDPQTVAVCSSSSPPGRTDRSTDPCAHFLGTFRFSLSAPPGFASRFDVPVGWIAIFDPSNCGRGGPCSVAEARASRSRWRWSGKHVWHRWGRSVLRFGALDESNVPCGHDRSGHIIGWVSPGNNAQASSLLSLFSPPPRDSPDP